MKIGIPREIHPGERRVAATPEVTESLVRLGFELIIESGAGEAASFADASYAQAGAGIVPDAQALWGNADIVLKVRGPMENELRLMRSGITLISFIWPAQHRQLLAQLAAKNATVLAMDCVPRISRAQKLDALSSMANIAGYRAVIEAAHHFGRFFTGQITAAGKVPPAKVFVIGAGVAGLAAIGTSVSLGAIVRANDTRPEVRDQVRSLGAEFVSVDYQEDGAGAGGYARRMSEGYLAAQRDVFARQAMDADILVTTALIPGQPAPKLITAGMVKSMHPGSVIVDMAAEQGGNCELTVPEQVVIRHGVTIIGYTDLPSRLPRQSSMLYATNLLHLIQELCPAGDGALHLDMEDEVMRGTTVLRAGAITWPPPPRPAPVAPPTAASSELSETPGGEPHTRPAAQAPRTRPLLGTLATFAAGALVLAAVGSYAPPAFMAHFTVFVLACFVGYMVVWNVTPALHTPLMSVTNAISSIIAIGALIQISSPGPALKLLAGASVMLTAVNMFGGFAVTQRMLAMFRK